jgi:hypothetical protein
MDKVPKLSISECFTPSSEPISAVLSNVFIYWGASEARTPCGDCNNNNNEVILIVILIKIITDLIF